MLHQKAEHTITLDDGTTIDLYIHYGHGTTGPRTDAPREPLVVYARLGTVERRTPFIASPPIDWPALELRVREWIALKHPW